MAQSLAVSILALVVALLDLLLILGIVRRLRALDTPPAPGDVPGVLDMGSGPSHGSRLPGFTAMTTTGELVDDSRYAGPAGCVAFVSVGCRPCAIAVDELGPYLGSAGIGREQTLVVVDGDPAAASQEAATAAGFAEVVTGAEATRLIGLFGVSGFPTLIAVQAGVVTASAPAVGVLRTAPGAVIARR